jgi:hypothetical protein
MAVTRLWTAATAAALLTATVGTGLAVGSVRAGAPSPASLTGSGSTAASAAAPLPAAATSVDSRSLPQTDPNMVVEITSPKPGERLRGRVEIAGYAADRRSPSGSGLNERDVQIYLNDSSDPWNLFDYALAGRDSPEAAGALGPAYSQTGFWDAWETCTFPEGPYRLMVWVSSLVSPGARSFASVDVYVEACAPGSIVTQRDFANEPGGVYTLHLEGPTTRGFSLDPIYADFAAGIDARCPQAGADCRYGLDFREQPGPGSTRTNSYYRFTVDPTDGTYTLGYSPPGDDPILPIVPWTASTLIRQGTGANRLAIIVQGDWLRLFINGQQVGEARDERRPWGQLGWTAETQDRGRAMDVQFANFVVSTPGPAERLAPIFPGREMPGAGAAPGAPAAVNAPTGAPPAANAPSNVLLSDDFTNPNSGWPRQSSDPTSRRVGYDGGEYVVAKMAGSSGAPLVTRAERFGDFLAQLDARLVPPTDGAYLFLDFRRQENGDHYSFVVDPNDSTFLVQRNVGSGSEALINWTTAPAIQGGGARNRIGVRAVGAQLTFLVNGQEVGSATDDRLREGSIAFGVGSLSDAAAEGRFGNLLVSSVN